VEVAANAGVGQIVGIGRAAMLFADNLIGRAAQERVGFRDQTVFTNPLTPSNDDSAQM
jgi:predicted GNAT family acetyltransferase